MGQRQRVQAIAIQNNRVLFGSGMIDEKQNRRFFIGGGIEEGETAEEAIIRELMEEANVEATIIFKFEKEYKENHHTFLVEIGEQEVSLGYDPEDEEVGKPAHLKALQKLEFIQLNQGFRFSSIDLEYFKILLEECNARSYVPEWYGKIKRLVENC